MPEPYNPSARCVIERAADILGTCLAMQARWEQEITDGVWTDGFGSHAIAFCQRQIEAACTVIANWQQGEPIPPHVAMILLEKFEPNWGLNQ